MHGFLRDVSRHLRGDQPGFALRDWFRDVALFVREMQSRVELQVIFSPKDVDAREQQQRDPKRLQRVVKEIFRAETEDGHGV